jgi:hypothetical protein
VAARVRGCQQCEDLAAGRVLPKPRNPPPQNVKPQQEEFLARARVVGLRKAQTELVGYDTYKRWRRDPVFNSRCKVVAAERAGKEPDLPIKKMSLEHFRRIVLGRQTYPHMRQWGTWMQDDDASHILIVTAPNCAKTTFVRDFLLWQLASQPTTRCAYASLSEKHGIKQIAAIQGVIEENTDLEAVAGTLKPAADQPHPWATTHFMVARRTFIKGQDEADFSLRAFGMSSQIVGSRIDTFIVDDPDMEGLSDVRRMDIYEKIMMNIESRLTPGRGKLIVICNRWGERDVASMIMDAERQNPGSWKIHSQPAIIREPIPDPRNLNRFLDPGEVIWPELFGTKTGRVGDPFTKTRAAHYFLNKRMRMGSRRFAIQYQNDPGSEATADFTPRMFDDALYRGEEFRRGKVPDGAIVICTQDPAIVEGCGHIAYALLSDGRRVLVDYSWDTGLREKIYDKITEFNRYKPDYWGIEAQGPWKAYAESPEVKDRMLPTTTYDTFKSGTNTYSGDIQVASIIPVMATKLVIPHDPNEPDWHRKFVSQFLTYRPPEVDAVTGRRSKSRIPYDLVMCVWLAERLIAERRLTEWFASADQDDIGWRNPYGDTFGTGSFAQVVG